MRVIKVSKPYSWLQWPVKLKNGDSSRTHVTAKFFGHADIDPDAVSDMLIDAVLPPIQARYPGIQWNPVMYSDIVPVLEFTRAPALFWKTHELFGLIKDQFEPVRFHITVSKDYWDAVIAMGYTPDNEDLTFGELELCLGEP